ncbi:MAG: DMT family transporter [Marinifilaceae bacterium]
MEVSKNTKGLVMVMLAAILYGLMPMLAKFSYLEGVNVISVLFYRYFLAFLMLTIFLVIKKKKLAVTKKQILPLFVASLVGTVFTTYSLFLSYDYISSGLASTLHFVYPSVTCLLALIIYKEHLGKMKLWALFLSVVGIALLSINGDVELNITGIFWALISGVFYAIYIICAANKELKKLSPFVVAFYIFLTSSLFFLIWGSITGELTLFIHPKAIFYIANLSFWATFMAVILFFVGVQQIGPSKAAVLSTFEPMTGVVLGLIVFHEQMNVNMLIGSMLVLVSVFLISSEDLRLKRKKVK